MNITIDIRTRILSDSHAIYLLFPGHAYKYSDVMLDKGLAFIDLPNIPSDVFEDKSINLRDKITDEMIVYSILIKRFQSIETLLTQDEYIQRNFENLLTQRKRFSVQKAALLNFLEAPKAGDIVVIPGPLYKSPVLIGEFQDDPGNVVPFEVPDKQNLQVFARKIRWLASPEKQSLPGSLVARLPSSNPFRRLEVSEYKTIYDIAYGSYKYKDLFVSQFKFGDEILKGDTSLFMGLFVYFVTRLNNSVDLGKVDLSYLDLKFIDEVIGEFEQRININSPGQYVFSRRNITPLLIAAMFSGFVAAGFSIGAGSSIDVSVTNSLQKDDHADKINKQIEEEIKRQWNGVNGDNLEKLARSARKMSEGGVSPRARGKK